MMIHTCFLKYVYEVSFTDTRKLYFMLSAFTNSMSSIAHQPNLFHKNTLSNKMGFQSFHDYTEMDSIYDGFQKFIKDSNSVQKF